MTTFKVIPNQGELPIAGYKQGSTYAHCAVNTKFWHGDLRAFDCPTLHCEKSHPIVTMMQLPECDCIAWDAVVDYAACYCNFVVWTGDGFPQIATREDFCLGLSCRLGIPCPTLPISASVTPCIDSRQDCLAACESAYETCKTQALSSCAALQAEVDRLAQEYDTCMGCGGGGDCDENRRAWAAKQLELNQCKRCAEDAIATCKVTLESCKAACPAETCCDKQYSSYMYRYVNKYGQVGVPSPPSNIVENLSTVTLGGVSPPPLEYCITGIEVFQLVAGNKTGLEKQIENNSGWLSLGIFPIQNTLTIVPGETGFPLDSWDYYPPPENLKGIVCTDYGLAGFEGKNVWYTEPNQINAWSKFKCLDHDVKALRYYRGALYALTDTYIYQLRSGQTESGYDFSIPYRYGDKPFPLLGDTRSVSQGQSGIFFPSVMGGVLITENSAQNITTKFAKDDWLALNPATMKTVMFDYGVGIFSSQVSYVYEFGDASFAGESSGHLYQLPMKPDAVLLDEKGILNYAEGNQWFKWDNCYNLRQLPCEDYTKGSCCCEYYWRSKPIHVVNKIKLTRGMIEFAPGTGNVKLAIYKRDCHDKPLFEKTFNEGTEQCRDSVCYRKYFNLPSCIITGQFIIELRGCAHVAGIYLSTSRKALMQYQ